MEYCKKCHRNEAVKGKCEVELDFTFDPADAKECEFDCCSDCRDDCAYDA